MTEHQLQKRVEYWRTGPLANLGLVHWDIEVRFTDGDPHGKSSAIAAVSTSKSYASAWMEFGRESFNAADPLVQDKHIVHELLHLAFRDLDNTFEDSCDHASSGAKDAYEERYDHEQEALIEGLARTIAIIFHNNPDASAFIPRR